MPFEYGMAEIASLECMITYSGKLPEAIWKRIGPSTAKIRYTDIEFATKAAPQLAEKAVEKWAKGGHWPILN